MYTKKNYVKLFLISVQEKELAICSESTACVLTPELHCFSQKETEPMLAKFAMEIRFFLPSLSKAVHGHLDSFLSTCIFDNFNFKSSISPVKDPIQHVPGHATGKKVYRSQPPIHQPPADACLVLRLGWILEEYSIFWV